MPTLDELKQKWFLQDIPFPPYQLPVRHPIASLSISTDNNLVDVIIGEGAAYFNTWTSLVQAAAAPSVRGSTLLHTAWKFDIADARQALEGAAASGSANVYALLNYDLLQNRDAPAYVDELNAGCVVAILDTNYPPCGSSHQKFFVQRLSNTDATLLTGSIDISKFGCHTPAIHQIGLQVTGPAIRDVEITFLDRWKSEYIDPPVNIIYPLENFTYPYPDPGPHSIQVLRTYGLYKAPPSGEFSIWASYLNAIQTAQDYIYIECEDFNSFDWPPCCERDPDAVASPARDTDLVYQLGEAVKRGVKVAAITNYEAVSSFDSIEWEKVKDEFNDWGNIKVFNYQKGRSIEYLKKVASTATSGGTFTVGKLKRRGKSPHGTVHTKLMLADDEFSVIGSANFSQRSMTHDNELMLGIVDRDNRFTKDLRVSLWREHLNQPQADLDDWSKGLDQLTTAIKNAAGNLRSIQLTEENDTYLHGLMLRRFADPYGGPCGPGEIRECAEPPPPLTP